MEHKHESDVGMKFRANIVWMVFLALAALLLFAEHWTHLPGWFSYWPYLLLLVCPFMHLFMHGGRGHGGHASGDASDESAKGKK